MLIRIFEIPMSDGKFVFGGRPKTFIEVDWFRDALEQREQLGWSDNDCPTITTAQGRTLLEEYIKTKSYFSAEKAFLVLAQEHSFTIGYSAP